MRNDLMLTGFEPFAGSSLNPSALLLDQLSGPAGWRTEKALLPVDMVALPSRLEALFAENAPWVVLSLGEARNSKGFRVERLARNWLDFRVPDNVGFQAHGVPVIKGAPPTYGTTLPAELLCAQLREAGLPAVVHDDAGGYLCNQLFYWCCHHFHGSATRVGFLHVPSLPEQGYDRGVSLDRQTRAVQKLLDMLPSVVGDGT